MHKGPRLGGLSEKLSFLFFGGLGFSLGIFLCSVSIDRKGRFAQETSRPHETARQINLEGFDQWYPLVN